MPDTTPTATPCVRHEPHPAHRYMLGRRLYQCPGVPRPGHLSCSLAALRQPHDAHDWQPQPGMDPLHCDGFEAAVPASPAPKAPQSDPKPAPVPDPAPGRNDMTHRTITGCPMACAEGHTYDGDCLMQAFAAPPTDPCTCPRGLWRRPPLAPDPGCSVHGQHPVPVPDPALVQRAAQALLGVPIRLSGGEADAAADAVLAELAPELARAQLGDRTRQELAELAVNAANALRDEKRHYEIACAEITRLRQRLEDAHTEGARLARLMGDLRRERDDERQRAEQAEAAGQLTLDTGDPPCPAS